MSVCVNGQCQNTMKDYICVCNAGFRSDPTKKLCNGKNIINTAGMAKAKKQKKRPPVFVLTMRELQRVVCEAGQRQERTKAMIFMCRGAPSDCFPEISKALEKLKISGQPFHSSKIFGGFPILTTIFEGCVFTFYYQDIAIIVLKKSILRLSV